MSEFDSTVEPQPPVLSGIPRRKSRQGVVAWGDNRVTVGGDAPVRVQSMTNTDTADVIGTAIQVKELAQAGSELVRITVNNEEAARAVPHIREQLDRMGIDVPLIGDFHYNGHTLLSDFPDMAQALSKYRINPGNVGRGDKKDRQFAQMVEAAARWNKPVRIGVNWGSLDQDLLAGMMDENARRAQPWDGKQVMYEALIASALGSATRAGELGLAVNTVARAYRELESAGVVETRGRQGTFVAARNPTEAAMAAAARSYADTARALGLGKRQALAYLDAEFD